VVGKISGMYNKTTANTPEIPNFPIMLNVILAGIRETSPVNTKAKHKHAEPLDFYCAMLSIARTMPSQDVSLSVCLSATCRYSVETVILRIFAPSGSHNILVCPHQRPVA